ncbi:TM2 domain-containing protein 3 [Thalassophryne amazonica]|uniref:TM2 domain-containing protein 3 n=1 Tax=Thalassophryne amazonica TaxID=390379 RepID=UPI001472031A|nr:TM2 domain-containing protein 3 [Thalassophryne amazonica]
MHLTFSSSVAAMANICKRPDPRRRLRTYGIVVMLFTDLVLQCVNGYLSSPHIGQEPPFITDAQHGPVITSPVVPAAASGTPFSKSASFHTAVFSFPQPHEGSWGGSYPTIHWRKGFLCMGESGEQQTNFSLSITCQFCWQLDPSQYRCSNSANCMTVSCPRKRYNATCDVLDHVHCLGKRRFQKRLFCNWTGGYKWSTAFALSITLGGFGADRFYLGQWREGLGKLFSFGGLGIWTLIDVLLIGVGYVGPADGSLYI